MVEKEPYGHTSRGVGLGSDSSSAEIEHRETARGPTEERNELNLEERNREKRYGPRTHDDTRIDPDPRFEEPNP